MPPSIQVAHVQGFHHGFYSLAQQRQSRFVRYVRQDGEIKGKWAWFQRLGSIEMVKRTSRTQDTNLVDQPHSRRGCPLDDYEVASLIDPNDLHKLLDDPQNAYIQNSVWGRNRQIDITILRAVNGTAVSADEFDAQTSNTLPAAQKIVAGGTGLTLTKLKDMREILHSTDAVMAEDEEELPCAISSKQMDDLLGITEVKSIDYNDGKALVKGRAARFMGFHFIETQKLQTDAASARLCLAWKPSAIGFRAPDGEDGVGTTSIDKRPDKGNAIQVLTSLTDGAVRIEDAAVVEIACVEA